MAILLAQMKPMAWTNKWRRSSIGANKLWSKWMHFWRKSISAHKPGWTHVLSKGKPFLFLIRHPPSRVKSDKYPVDIYSLWYEMLCKFLSKVKCIRKKMGCNVVIQSIDASTLLKLRVHSMRHNDITNHTYWPYKRSQYC